MPKSILSPRSLEVLRQLAALPEGHDDAEILADGLQCWMGAERLHRRTVNSLIYCTAISRAYDGALYWLINDTGRAIARRPELADEVYATVMIGRGAFSIINDRIVNLEEKIDG